MKKTFLLLLFSFVPLLVFSQSLVNGKVKTTEGEMLPGVQILEKGTTNGTITDLEGNFKINVTENVTLIVSYIGYKTQEIELDERTNIEITLEVAETGLDEVVVIGYGTTKKKLNTGANLNVKGEDIQQLTPSNAMDALKGISPGVSITQSNGQPGAGNKVYIRGIGTTGNSNPLYIVDGVAVGNIDYLSSADIETIDVLKDAASAAIYGSRAANGVILVATKKGKKGNRPVITYDAYTGWQNVYKKPDLLNAKEYITIMNEAEVNDGLVPTDFSAILANYHQIENGTWKGTNWFDEITVKDAYIQSHAINVTGGSEKSIYSIGASYLNDEGILGGTQANSNYKRLNLRLNTEHVILEKDGLKTLVVGQNLSYTNSENPGIRTGDIYWNDVHNTLITPPIMPVYAENGDYHGALMNWSSRIPNPVALMEILGKYNYNKSNSIVGNVYMEINPVKGLNFR
ncbi:MAG: SusC/RagA family TonB-linked outer membrane protein, partial [Bacteroidales bacterium]|nr:SusC/RagA family TonB-linked outer membrane protein [Bacteroidales bacterium]